MKKVRLSHHDLHALEETFRFCFGGNDKLWIFGSRVDLNKKGGDIDLYVETYAKTVDEADEMRSNYILALEQKIGEQKIDIVMNMLNFPYSLSIHEEALKTGVRIV